MIGHTKTMKVISFLHLFLSSQCMLIHSVAFRVQKDITGKTGSTGVDLENLVTSFYHSVCSLTGTATGECLMCFKS